MIKIISAFTVDLVYGEHDHVVEKYSIPWFKCNNPRDKDIKAADMKRFINYTKNKVVVMGNNTFKSMNCIPLKNRTNIILTRNKYLLNSNPAGYKYYSSIYDVLKDYDEIIIIGGTGLIINVLRNYGNKVVDICFDILDIPLPIGNYNLFPKDKIDKLIKNNTDLNLNNCYFYIG